MLGCACPPSRMHRRADEIASPHSDRPISFNASPRQDRRPETLQEPRTSEICLTSADVMAMQSPSSREGMTTSTQETLPAPATSVLPQTLNLRDTIDLALIQSPGAITARAAGPVGDAVRVVTATYPWNPTVQVEVAPYARDIDGNLLATKNHASLTQTLELSHQPRYRRRLAEAGWNEQHAIIAQGELTAVVTAVRAYFDALYRKGLRDLTTDSAALQAKTSASVDRQFNAGLATPASRLTASVSARQAKRLAQLADADYQNAFRSLRIALNLAPSETMELDSNLTSYNWAPADDALEQAPLPVDDRDENASNDASFRLISNRPDVIAARFAISAARSNLLLAKANTVPNIATGPTYERDESGTLFFGVAAQMDLPVWNTGYPLVRQRSAELQQQLVVWEQTRETAALQARAAVQRYTMAYKLWLERWSAKDAGQNDLKNITDAFDHGQASIVEVLSIQDSLIQERRSYLDLLNELSQAAVDVVAALAIDPELLIEAPSGEASGSVTQP